MVLISRPRETGSGRQIPVNRRGRNRPRAECGRRSGSEAPMNALAPWSATRAGIHERW